MFNFECSIQNLKLNRDRRLWRCKPEKISEPGVQIASGVVTGGGVGGVPLRRVSPFWLRPFYDTDSTKKNNNHVFSIIGNI